MHFLHTDPEQAALAVCDEDVEAYLVECLVVLKLAVSNDFTPVKPFSKWLEEDSANYHWLAYFAERLSLRLVDSAKYWSEIQSLRRSAPTRMRFRSLTDFPRLFNYDDFAFTNPSTPESVAAAYRADYVLARHKYAEWSAVGCPGWFFRLANTLLSERERSNFLQRVQPAGPSGAEHEGSSKSEREDVRDGPMGTITGDDHREYRIW